MIVEFTSAAKIEFFQAIDNYNVQLPGLGYEFAAAIEQAVAKIVQHPQAWTPYGKYTRRCIVSRFPYGILYLPLSHNDHPIKRPNDWTNYGCRGAQ